MRERGGEREREREGEREREREGERLFIKVIDTVNYFSSV